MYGQEFERVREMYDQDIHFRMLVDTMENMIHTGKASIHELRQAATYASIRYEIYHMKPLLIHKP